jgi:hypothetical protein
VSLLNKKHQKLVIAKHAGEMKFLLKKNLDFPENFSKNE